MTVFKLICVNQTPILSSTRRRSRIFDVLVNTSDASIVDRSVGISTSSQRCRHILLYQPDDNLDRLGLDNVSLNENGIRNENGSRNLHLVIWLQLPFSTRRSVRRSEHRFAVISMSTFVAAVTMYNVDDQQLPIDRDHRK